MKNRILTLLLIVSMIMSFAGCVTFVDQTREDPKGVVGLNSADNADSGTKNGTDNDADNDAENGAENSESKADAGKNQDSVTGGVQTSEGSMTAAEASYRLKEPQFIELSNISLCQAAEDYIKLSDEEFTQRYSDEKLWELGAFDRLLFTKYSKGKIIGDIGIGSTLQQVLDTFGNCQFGTTNSVDKAAYNYERYLLYGYKTRDFYIAFRIDHDTQLVDSICFRKRYPLPDDMKDMLVILSKSGDWYGGDYTGDTSEERMDEWNRLLDSERIQQTQWGRGTLTIICDYGFTSTSGMDLSYGVYADYSGDIPVLPERKSEWDEETYEPVTVFDMDYPECMIYRIYSYLAEQEDAIRQKKGVLSPDGSTFAYAVEGDWLDMRSSGLYEWAHVVFHSMDGKHPDIQQYFGHFSSLVGFINDRYFAETNMMGLHVVDLKDWSIVYSEDTIEGGYDLRLDKENKQILDSEGNVWYTYKFDSAGRITVQKVSGQ